MSGKILVIEDELHIRTLLERTFEELVEENDVLVLFAGDGVEGLDQIRDRKPDLIFLDIMMPKMSGYDVLKEVRKDDELSDIPIILLTAKGQELDRKKGLELGATAYITKPFSPDEVLNMAKSHLGISD